MTWIEQRLTNNLLQKAAMDATLAGMDIDDPTAAGAEDEIAAPGVTDQATQKVIRDKKKAKGSKSADVDMEDADADAAAASRAEKKRRKAEAEADPTLDADAIAKKLKKEKKDKRKSEGLANGEVPDAQIKKSKKSKSL